MVCECDREDSTMRRPWVTIECGAIEKVYSKIHSKELKETLIRINKMYKILLSNAKLLYKI